MKAVAVLGRAGNSACFPVACVVGLQPPCACPALPRPGEVRAEPPILAGGKHPFGHVAMLGANTGFVAGMWSLIGETGNCSRVFPVPLALRDVLKALTFP